MAQTVSSNEAEYPFDSNFDDPETWLLKTDDDCLTESTNEWLAGATTEANMTKSTKALLKYGQQKKRPPRNGFPVSSTMLTSVTEESNKQTMGDSSDSETEEFFDAPSTFENDYRSTSAAPESDANSISSTPRLSTSVHPHSDTLRSSFGKGNHAKNPYRTLPKDFNSSLAADITDGSKKNGKYSMETPKRPNIQKSSSQLTDSGSLSSRSRTPNELSPRVISKSPTSSPNTTVSALELKAQEQLEKLKEQVCHVKKAESRPTSSASAASAADNIKNSTNALATSKSADFRVEHDIASGDSRPGSSAGHPSRIPVIHRSRIPVPRGSSRPPSSRITCNISPKTNETANVLANTPLKRPNGSNLAMYRQANPSEGSPSASSLSATIPLEPEHQASEGRDPWGDNCF